MTYISDGALYSMRLVANQTLAGTAVIMRPADTPDGQGGFTQAYAAAGTVSCNLAPEKRRGGDENTVGDRLQSSSGWYLTLPATTDIAYRDRVITGGGTFEVTGIREPRPIEIVRRATLSQIL